jgi:hypothetical protein
LVPLRPILGIAIGAAAVACVVVVGCTPNVVPLGTTEVASCVDQPFRAELHVDARDLRLAWATSYDTGRVVAVRLGHLEGSPST